MAPLTIILSFILAIAANLPRFFELQVILMTRMMILIMVVMIIRMMIIMMTMMIIMTIFNSKQSKHENMILDLKW